MKNPVATFVIVCTVGFPACQGSPPTEAPEKWVQAASVEPANAPYGVRSEIRVGGSGLDGIQQARFVLGAEVKPGTVLSGVTSTSVSVLAPHYERPGQATIIVSEGTASYNQTDTVPGYLNFVGPAYPDTLPYEYRSSTGKWARWEVDRFPLHVYTSGFPDVSLEPEARQGVLLWENAVSEGVPSFMFTNDSLEADIIFRNKLSAGSICSTFFFPEFIHPLDRVYIRCIASFLGDERLPRDVRVIAAHEVGHALGLLRHSYRLTDIMGSGFSFESPSSADFATLRHLYAR